VRLVAVDANERAKRLSSPETFATDGLSAILPVSPRWPPYLPPFGHVAPLLEAPNGHVVVRRVAPVSDRRVRYDEVDRTGRLVRHFVLPTNERIIGFGVRSAFIAVEDDAGLLRLERREWK
jgi:hypothetical protein